MCTAASFKTRDHYFGRNLDLEYSYHETVTITPRDFPFHFRKMGLIAHHYAMIGMAFVAQDYPLYYDATNEKGLSMAGLNFPGNACYFPEAAGKDNVAPFELIPWILCQCETVAQARVLLSKMNLMKMDFSAQLPASPLHWMIADKEESIVVESVKEGLKVYDDPAKVLTNNPTFDYHMTNLVNYMALSPKQPENCFGPGLELTPYSRGMGAMGLPGDLSSASRFVKAAFTRLNSVCGDSESASISQFFQILGSVAQQKGCVLVGDKYEYTIYTSCCNTDQGIYYYNTYENSQLSCVHLHHENLDSDGLISFPLIQGQQVLSQN